MEAILGIIGFVVFIHVILAAVLATQFYLPMGLKQIELSAKDKRVQSMVETNEWAKENDFEFAGFYRARIGFINAFLAAWRRPDRPTFLCRYIIADKTAIDIVTEFNQEVSLTTANIADGHTTPKPSYAYHQSFSGLDLEEQWRLHIETENFLIDEGGSELVQDEIDFETAFRRDVTAGLRYVGKLWYWPACPLYWQFVRKHKWHNKSIQQQYEKGMVRLPKELSEAELPLAS